MSPIFLNSSETEEHRPLVSILVPSYNHEAYVIDCLQSIYGVDYPRLELIVSDDCSPDRTYELAREWVHDHADRFENSEVIRQPTNLGVVRNLQFLLDRAQGKYLAYLASDDELVESSIAPRVQILEEQNDLDAVFGDAQEISGTGTVLKERFIPRSTAREFASKRLLLVSLILNWCIPGPVMLLRKQVTSPQGSLGVLPADLGGEDRYIYLSLASKQKLIFLDTVVARYRHVQNSLSRGPSSFRASIEYLLKSDMKIASQLNGFSLVVMRAKIARFKIALNQDASFYQIRKTFWRGVLLSLKILLRVRGHFQI